MRILLTCTFTVWATMSAVWGQQPPEHKAATQELLVQLHSNSAEVRSDALQHLRSDPIALRDPSIKTALVGLLDKENRLTMSREEEGYAEYVSRLADTVAKIVDWNDTHQVCILASGADLPDELASHARVAIPCLLKRLEDAPAPIRGTIVAMLVQALATGKSDLDTHLIQSVQEATVKALGDPESGVRIDTIKSLQRFGGTEMIPALTIVAKTDPDPSEGYAIRKWATEAIAAIEERASQR